MLKNSILLSLSLIFLTSCAAQPEKQSNSSEPLAENAVSGAATASEIATENGALVAADGAVSPQNTVFEQHCEPLTDPQRRWLHDAAHAAERLPVAYSSIWSRIVAGYQLPVVDNRRIAVELRWFERNPDYLQRVSVRAEPHLHFVATQVQNAGLPLELALLPIVESAFNPYAYSRSRALGIWQFIAPTGKRFGLQQNGWYDGRRDIRASTRAAIEYLSYLHRLFDRDWLLALAAYNTGEGNLRKAIRRNKRAGKPTDFWSLRLPKETRDYVPRLLALAKLVRSPERYSNELLSISDEAKWEPVDLGVQSDLHAVADLMGWPRKELKRYNPGFNHALTPPHGPYEILVPLGRAKDFKRALARADLAPVHSEFEYKVRYGDTLSEIAQQYGIGLAALKSRNGLRNSRIREGQKLSIPDQNRGKLHSGGPVKITHKVRAGETLSELALEYNVSVAQLADWNGMRSIDSIRAGKQLLIWTHVAQTQ